MFVTSLTNIGYMYRIVSGVTAYVRVTIMNVITIIVVLKLSSVKRFFA